MPDYKEGLITGSASVDFDIERRQGLSSSGWRKAISALRAAGAEYLVPPVVKQHLALVFHRWMGDATVFEGDFSSWREAERLTDGYDAPSILERSRKAALRIKDDPGTFERDATLLAEPEYSFPALAALLWIAARNGGRLNVLDFGGALGSTFFQFRRFLTAIPALRWAVVEQPHYVECGRREIGGGGLSFHSSIDDALTELRPDVVLLSSVLQYLPAPHDVLAHIVAHRFDYLLFDRTAFHNGPQDRLTIQQNPPIHGASYPAWFFNKSKLLTSLSDAYVLVYEFPASDRVLLAGGRAEYYGFLFERTA